MKRNIRICNIPVIVATFVLMPPLSHADTWYVDATAPTTGQTGANWDHPFVTIQQAVAEAVSGDEIRVAGGTYKPSSQTATINLANGVSIQGGYVGYPLSEASDNRTEVSILSGDLVGNDFDNPPVYTDNAHNVVFIPNGTQPPSQSATDYADRANLDGFTITAGRGHGGIRTDSVNATGSPDLSVIIRNCRIHNNYALDLTGAPDGNGGGIRVNADDQLVLRKCKIFENHADTFDHGGGMFVLGHTTILDCEFYDNTALEGGAIKCEGANLNIVSTSFTNNQAGCPNSGSGRGGALSSDSSIKEIRLINSSFIGNCAGRFGGAINITEVGTLEMVNCTVSGNSVAESFGHHGGGLFLFDVYQDASITNSIFWDNDAYEYPEIRDVHSVLTVTYSIVEGGWPGNGNDDDDPDFEDAVGGDYRLQCGSPAINTGLSSIVPDDAEDVDEDEENDGDPTRDLDLLQRIVGSAVDMGAYEKQPPACPGDTDNSGAVNVDDLLAVINAWGSCSAPCPADVAPDPCGNGTANVDDLLAVINNWGGCDGVAGGGFPETISECFDVYCAQLSGEDWQV